MFGINKNGTKHKIGIIMPAFFPASRVTYGRGTVEDALRNGFALATITTDGVKTWSQIYDDLYSLISLSDVSPRCVLRQGSDYFVLAQIQSNGSLVFSRSNITAARMDTSLITLKSSGSVSAWGVYINGAYNYQDASSNVPTSGTVVSIYQ